jgi:LysM domain
VATLSEQRGVPRGCIRLSCDDPAADLILLLGAEPPKITGGIGGWEVTARPRQIGMTTWQGSEPFQVQLSVMLDGYATGVSVEPTLRKLVTIGRGDDESPPGVLTITGVPMPADDWVLEALEFGDALLRSSDGSRVRQPLALTLREYVPPTFLQLRRGALQGPKGKTKVMTARKGDTPAKIARRQECKWTDLRDLNPALVRKANQALKTGTKLRAPVAQRKDRRPRSSTVAQRGSGK